MRNSISLAEQRWIKCPNDGALIFHKILQENLNVCPECGHHFRLTARERLASLVDPGSFQELSGAIEPDDPLGFVDSKPYAERLREAQRKTGEKEGAIFGTARIEEQALVVAIMDFAFIGGAMGSAIGEVITQAVETARAERLPLLIVCASGGARMQEGCISLMQMAKTSAALSLLAEERLPYFVLLTDPTYGGVTASFATLGDLLIAEPRARIGFAGRSVVESTIRQTLPADFQCAEFLLEHGMIDMIVPRGGLRHKLGQLLAYYQPAVQDQRQSPAALPDVEDFLYIPAHGPKRDAWEIVKLARQQGRPTTLDYINYIFDEFHPLQGDRLFGEDEAIVGGLARLGDLACMVIGTQKGRSLRENLDRNFGMPHPEGYRKALRLMRQAAKFQLPILTFVDTLGAFPGNEAEERGQALAIAQNLFEMARLPVPIVAMLTGEGGSGGALALAVADRVLMLENAYYSVITPEGCSIILYKNVNAAAQAAKALGLTARDLEELGVIDEIVPEPPGGAHTDPRAMAEFLKGALTRHLRDLLPKEPAWLLEERQARFRAFGTKAREDKQTRSA